MKKQVLLKKAVAGLVATAVMGSAIAAGPFESSLNIEKRINTAAAQTQGTVDQLADQTTDLSLDYRNTLQRVDSLRIYNAQMERQIASQRKQINESSTEMESIDETEKGVLPLMDDMIKTLDEFVQLDIPFNIDDRQARIQKLYGLMDDANVSVSEKYRKILEAYQIEAQYGNVVDATSGDIEKDGSPLAVDFLRVGRMSYVYLTKDGKAGAYWDKQSRQWQPLPEDYLESVGEAVKMAKGTAQANLFKVPVPVAEAAQ
ncbi:MAG: DUF3450 domain-containing protein [Kangiellaceae bacterium]|nr:DUF3450 domain-containing protein [Kangiellaceae bacterium]